MVGLLSADPPAPDAIGANLSELVPSTVGDVADPLSLTRMAARAIQRAGDWQQAEPGQNIPMGMVPYGGSLTAPAPEPLLSSEDANKQFGISGPGGLTFKNPVPASVARDLNQAKQNEIALADARARRPGGTWNAIAGLGANFVANALDPLNIAAAFVPVVGEGRYAAWLGSAGERVLARMAVRGAVGAAQGAVGQLPLSALRYGLSQAEQADYTAGDVLSDVAMGAFLGAAAHAVPGTLADVVTGRYRAAVRPDAEASTAAARTAVSQLVQGDPVEVQPVVAADIIGKARQDLQTWVGQSQRANADMDALGGRPTPAAPNAAIAETRAGLMELAEQERGLQADLGAAQERAIRGAMDPETAERIAQVEQELGGTIPKARRASLEAEHALLMEGRGAIDTGAPELAAQRTAAEVRGLQAALERTTAARTAAQGRLDELLARDQAEVVKAAAAEKAAQPIERARMAAAESRLVVARAMAAKSIRRFAWQVGAQLEDGEATAIAGRVLKAAPRAGETEAAQREIEASLQEIAKRGGKTTVAAPATDEVAEAAQAAERRLTEGAEASEPVFRRATEPRAEPTEEAPAEGAEAAPAAGGANAPAKPGEPAGAEPQPGAEPEIEAARAAGMLGADDEAELQRTAGLLARAKALGSAVAEAASCLAGAI